MSSNMKENKLSKEQIDNITKIFNDIQQCIKKLVEQVIENYIDIYKKVCPYIVKSKYMSTYISTKSKRIKKKQLKMIEKKVFKL